jgi:hypothetical protein
MRYYARLASPSLRSFMVNQRPRFVHANVWPYLCLALLAGAVCAPMLFYGAPNGHSIEYNLVWLQNFASQLAVGDVYPRWLMDMNGGAGSPVFYFYAPLPFYLLSMPALLLPAHTLGVQLAVGEWLIIALSGISFFWVAKSRFSTRSAFISALFYMLLPYHFEIDLWLRQDLGELCNYIWMPLALHFSERLIAGQHAIRALALTYALMLLSHLPSTLLFSIAMGFYLLSLAWRRHHWRFIAHFTAAICLGILLSGLYWLPALFSQQYIRTDQLWSAVFDFHRWFYPLHGEPLDPGVEDPFAQRLFAMIGLTTVMFSLCWLNAYRWRHVIGRQALLSCLLLVAIAWFLMSPYSRVIWETVPELWKVQFPWRISLVLDVATAIALLHSLHGWELHRDRISCVVLAVVAGLLLYSLSSASIWQRLDPFDSPSWVSSRDQAVREGVDAPEYSTNWNPHDPEDESNPLLNSAQLLYTQANGTVSILRWAPRLIVLQLDLQHATALRIRQFYYPNWHAETPQGALALQADPATGLLLLQAPAGRYTLSVHMRPLMQEWLGGLLSVLGLGIWLGGWGYRRHMHNRARQYNNGALTNNL